MLNRLGLSGVKPRVYVPENPDAYLTFDWTRDRYRKDGVSARAFNSTAISGLSISRTHTNFTNAYAQTAAGLLVPFAANVARRTDKGLLVEESRTNKSTNTNVNPSNLTNVTKSGDAAATISVVDDSAALAAIGLTGNVFRLNNTAGTGEAYVAIGGTVGNTNAHSVSAYVRGSGTAEVRLSDDVGAAAGTVALTSAYQRKLNPNLTPGATTAQLIIEARAGADVYFILNQLEEGSFVTSPIPVAGSSATRGADSVVLTGLSVPGSALTMLAEVLPITVGTGLFPYAVQLDDGTNNNRVALYGFQNRAAGQVTTAGASQYTQEVTASLSTATPTKDAISISGTTLLRSTLGVTRTGATITAPGTITRLSLTQPAVAAYIQRVILKLSADNQTALNALTQ